MTFKTRYSLNLCESNIAFIVMHINQQDGNTPLHIACEYGFFGLVLMLIDRGAGLEISNKVCHIYIYTDIARYKSTI